LLEERTHGLDKAFAALPVAQHLRGRFLQAIRGRAGREKQQRKFKFGRRSGILRGKGDPDRKGKNALAGDLDREGAIDLQKIQLEIMMGKEVDKLGHKAGHMLLDHVPPMRGVRKVLKANCLHLPQFGVRRY
jgi:hypothetical protein